MNTAQKKDLVKQIVGVLTALIPVLGVAGIGLEWFNEDFIKQFEVLAVAALSFGYTVYAIYKNHFAGKKAQAQLTLTEQRKRGLK